MELHKNTGIWDKGESELSPLEPVVMEPLVYLLPRPAEGSLASLEIQAELYVTPCMKAMMHSHTSRCPSHPHY